MAAVQPTVNPTGQQKVRRPCQLPRRSPLFMFLMGLVTDATHDRITGITFRSGTFTLDVSMSLIVLGVNDPPPVRPRNRGGSDALRPREGTQ